MAWASEQEKVEQFHAETCEHRPADPGDFRFEIIDLQEEAAKEGYSAMEDCPAIDVKMIDDKGEVVRHDRVWTRSDAFDMVEAFRETQDTTLEERLAPFGPEWEREQIERGRGW